MRLALVALQNRVDFHWIECDIDREADLIRRYDTKVPVLEYQGDDVCHYFIDEQAIQDIVAKQA